MPMKEKLSSGEAAVVAEINVLRTGIAALAQGARELKDKLPSNESPVRSVGGEKAEVIANVTLALRHLEDAALRLGHAANIDPQG
jgi:hypothetical protein